MNPETSESAANSTRSLRTPSNCHLMPLISQTVNPSNADFERLEAAGCPIASSIQDRIAFETLLVDLSASFVNVSGNQVDSQIVSGLKKIVEFLGIDRSGLGQTLPGEKDVTITHSYEVEGVAPSPKVVLESQFPVYARKVQEGVPFCLPDDVQDIPEAHVERDYFAQSGLKSQLTIPLVASGAIVGGIGFASFRSRIEWSDDLVQRLRLVGDIFTNALARKQADDAIRSLASKLLTTQEEERRRIAREMHDDWTQRLAVLGLEVARLEESIGEPNEAATLIHTIHQRLVGLSRDVHDLSRQLHPAILDELGLVEALRSECDAFSRREQIAVDFQADTVPSGLNPEVRLGLYRIAQEALRNLAKHAAVTECWISLVAKDGSLELTIRDKGIGFDPKTERRDAGIGIVSLEERAPLIGARLSIISSPGQGTTVCVIVRPQEANR